MSRPDVPDAATARRMLALLREDELDAAIEAGLTRFEPLDALDDADNQTLAGARDRLLAAWAARDRHRTRAARLQRNAGERVRAARPTRPQALAGTTAGSAGTDTDTETVDVDADTPPATDSAGMHPVPPRPALPATAAAALARARARASGKSP